MKNLLIVESPAKAKTIGKYLGKDYEVVASFGHIRDLPSKNGSVEPDKGFHMHYEISPKSTKYVKAIVDKAKTCDKIILAPDPDREGESIAWHVAEVLKQKKAIGPKTKIERVVFNSITKSSILEAVKNPRDVDIDLVNAQQARRALDYLVGFTLSPVLWRKLPGSRSAGRVQSVALRIICDREDEIEAFKSEEYWDIKVDLKTDSNQKLTATLTHINDKRLEKFSITNKKQAEEISKLLQDKNYQVIAVNKKEVRRKPYPPFITSSLQQEAARKLGFSSKKTMQIAQKLYEGLDVGSGTLGLITYMRTDGVDVSPEAITASRDFINKNYGKNYLPEKPIFYKSKAKNAQEAHEAIRPTDFSLPPKAIAQYLEKDFLALYDLIWKRMIASQMADIVMDQTTATIKTIPNYGELRVTGSVIKFDGFGTLYNEDKDDEEDEEKMILPDVKVSDNLNLLEVKPAQHFTEPPPRYSEASLVKKMEELGIGRPSTYASIISVLQDRDYVRLERKRFFPEERGRVVVVFLKSFFPNYVEYDYTAKLEDDLDIISNGKLDWKKFLESFWVKFNGNIGEVSKKAIPEILESLNQHISPYIFGVDENGKAKHQCPSCGTGTLGIKIGGFGVFVGCSNYPDCKYTKSFVAEKSDPDNPEDASSKKAVFEPILLGDGDKKGDKIFIKKGPYGLYIELANEDLKPAKEEEVVDKKIKTKAGGKKTTKAKKEVKPKPKRVSVPKNMKVEEVDLKLAKKLLSLPREVGIHPETGLKIIASVGPFGPYLLHDGKYSSVKEDDILEVGLNRAVDIITEVQNKKASKSGFVKKRKK
ncbi:MAG: topA [Rickettsiaceae bacterium]|jgi:DNA topoisomerase-1|nr:topA [Rickettsiaceae bacterium]